MFLMDPLESVLHILYDAALFNTREAACTGYQSEEVKFLDLMLTRLCQGLKVSDLSPKVYKRRSSVRIFLYVVHLIRR